mgnify:FL=1
MSEFCPSLSDIAQREDYAPADSATVEIIIDYLDHIINMQNCGRSAFSSDEKFSEWFETEMLLSDSTVRTDALMSEMRIAIRRTDDKDYKLGGETYTVLMDWRCPNQNEIIDNSYTRAYVFMRPHSYAYDESTMMMCYQQSNFITLPNGEMPEVGNIDSSYHEVDLMLEKSFLRWQRGSQYDAEKLFDELTLFNDMLIRKKDF